MKSLEHGFVLSLVGSCTTDEAVAHLLGWGDSTICQLNTGLIRDGTVQQDRMVGFGGGFNLQEALSDIYIEALLTQSAALPEGASDEDVQHAVELHGPRIEEAEAFIKKARAYMLDIVDELSKGDESALRQDREATAQSGTTYITIRSLEAWGEAKYAVIADTNFVTPEPDIQALLETVKDVDGTAKSDASLYVTLALAVQAFAKIAGPKYLRDGAEVNVLQVAEHLEALGAGQRQQPGGLPGQSASSIRGRINKALAQHRIVRQL